MRLLPTAERAANVSANQGCEVKPGPEFEDRAEQLEIGDRIVRLTQSRGEWRLD